jgi:general secretion pathway protein G
MRKKGFTLIELLVAMTVIAVLTGMALVSFQGSRQSARDAKRKADLEQIRSALEMCRSDTNAYPATIPVPTGNLCYPYLGSKPSDPKSGQTYYYSGSNNAYTLCAALEIGGIAGSCGTNNCGTVGTVTCNYIVRNP